MKAKEKFVSWVKAHKTELIIAGVTVVGHHNHYHRPTGA